MKEQQGCTWESVETEYFHWVRRFYELLQLQFNKSKCSRSKRPRRASVSLSEAFPPKHLIFRLKAEICSEAANGATEVSRHHVSAERQCDTGATAAVLNSRASAADQIPPQSATRGWLPLFYTFRTLSMSMNENSGRSHFRVFQWETKHQEVLSFNEFVSFALIQK